MAAGNRPHCIHGPGAQDGCVPPLHSVPGPTLKRVLLIFRVCLPNSIKGTPGQPNPPLRLPSQTTADFAKLTTNINQHTRGYFPISTRSVTWCLDPQTRPWALMQSLVLTQSITTSVESPFSTWWTSLGVAAVPSSAWGQSYKGHVEQTWTSALPNSVESSQTAVNLQAGQRDINTWESKATEVWKLLTVKLFRAQSPICLQERPDPHMEFHQKDQNTNHNCVYMDF